MKTHVIALSMALIPTLSFADDSWTGFSAGLQLSTVDVSSGVNKTGNDSFGIHAGYLHDFDGYVLGGELSYDVGVEVVSNGQLEKIDTVHAKLKGGRVFGKTLVYGVAGYANMDGDSGSTDGYSVGVGVSYRATEKVLVGAEYLRDTFNTAGGDTKADSFSLRLSYKF